MFENFKKLSKFRKIITRKGVEVFTNNNKQNREISPKKLITNAQTKQNATTAPSGVYDVMTHITINYWSRQTSDLEGGGRFRKNAFKI